MEIAFHAQSATLAVGKLSTRKFEILQDDVSASWARVVDTNYRISAVSRTIECCLLLRRLLRSAADTR